MRKEICCKGRMEKQTIQKWRRDEEKSSNRPTVRHSRLRNGKGGRDRGRKSSMLVGT